MGQKRRAFKEAMARYDVAKRDFDPGVGGGVDRDKLPTKDFADPKNRKFPIHTPADVADAAGLAGHAKNPAKVRARIRSIARRKGPEFEAEIPDSWKDAKSAALKYSEGQPRDDHGRWTSGGEGSGPAGFARDPSAGVRTINATTLYPGATTLYPGATYRAFGNHPTAANITDADHLGVRGSGPMQAGGGGAVPAGSGTTSGTYMAEQQDAADSIAQLSRDEDLDTEYELGFRQDGPGAGETPRPISKYDDAEPRDDAGRWTAEAGGADPSGVSGRFTQSDGNAKISNNHRAYWSSAAAGHFAQGYVAHAKAQDGTASPREQKIGDAFERQFTTLSNDERVIVDRAGFVGSGEAYYRNNQTGATFHVDRMANGKSFWGTDHSITQLPPGTEPPELNAKSEKEPTVGKGKKAKKARKEYRAALARVGSSLLTQAERFKYDDSQPRDDHGRWAVEGAGASGVMREDALRERDIRERPMTGLTPQERARAAAMGGEGKNPATGGPFPLRLPSLDDIKDEEYDGKIPRSGGTRLATGYPSDGSQGATHLTVYNIGRNTLVVPEGEYENAAPYRYSGTWSPEAVVAAYRRDIEEYG